MIKREELTNPESCMSSARDEEMTFVLLARDAAAPATINFWVSERIRLGKNSFTDPQIVEALECANRMRQQHNQPLPARSGMKMIDGHPNGDPMNDPPSLR